MHAHPLYKRVRDRESKCSDLQWLSLQARISLAHGAGVGVAIWELGQGLDEFMGVLAHEEAFAGRDREL